MEFKIEVPIGYEIDKEKSTFEKIVFKKSVKELPKSWYELKKINGGFVFGGNVKTAIDCTSNANNVNIFKTGEQAWASIALAQLSQLRDVYRDGWVPDWTTPDTKYVIWVIENEVKKDSSMRLGIFLSFQDSDTRDLFFENFKGLIEIAKPLMS